MEPFQPKLILVPTDFSDTAAHALRYASALAERFDAHLLILNAATLMTPADFLAAPAGVIDYAADAIVEQTRESLQRHAEENVAATVPFDVRVIVGTVLDVIDAETRASGANLIVMGTHGRRGVSRLLFGSVTELVMRMAPVPVIAVNADACVTGHIEKILCPVSFTPASREALRRAAALVESRQAPLVLVREGDPTEAQDRVERMLELRRWVPPELVDRCEIKATTADDAATIVTLANETHTDLIALGLDALHTSLAEQIVRRSRCAVLTMNEKAVAGPVREPKLAIVAS